jgi:DNA ligase (NAD+)
MPVKTEMTVSELVAKLEAASFAYHNGKPELMTDAAYDTAVEQLRAADSDHPFLKKVGAPVTTGDEVALPIPLPSLNKMKDADAIEKWVGKNPAPIYHISVKLDGCSALWLPGPKKLYTRGDGMRGRDISHFAPYFNGFPSVDEGRKSTISAVRGELIMRTDSTAIPAGKLARNIVAGALNRKVVDTELFAEIQFVAYELIGPLKPVDAFKLMKTAGYKTAMSLNIPVARMETDYLSNVFTAMEDKSLFQLDGIVIAPNLDRPSYNPVTRNGEAVNPTDRAAWKTRVTASTARTTVREVEWNVSHQGFLIPRVLFDTVTLAGANISAATGLHGRWIFDSGVGPGAIIEVRRAGDVIPQIIAVHSRVEPSMPTRYAWASDEAGCIHIKPVGDDALVESECIKLTHALAELGAENVGSGLVAKMYSAGFTTVGAIYKATAATFAAKVDGCKEKGAERLWAGLRVKQSSWTTLNFMVASCTMPRGVGHTKLKPLLALEPRVELWVSPSTAATFKANRPAGLSDKTIDAILETIPAYIAWASATGLTESLVSAPAPAKPLLSPDKAMTVVFTGVRDKELEAALQTAGHIVADTVSKKTTHVVYADGPQPTTTKITKAKEVGAELLTLSEFRGKITV